MSLTVRKGAAKDAVRACEIVRRSILECCAEDHRNDPAIVASWLRNKTPENFRSWFESDSCALVAEVNGELVGTAMLKADGMIVLFYVVPEARFSGIGKAMLHALEVEAAKRRLKRIELDSTKTAYDFHLRNGFRDTGFEESAFGLSARRLQKVIGEPASITGTRHPSPVSNPAPLKIP